MELTPNLEDFAFKIFEKKEYESKEINNRIVYLPCTREDLERDIDSLSNPHLINLKDLIKAIEEKASDSEKKAYEVKDLNALREELARIRALK